MAKTDFKSVDEYINIYEGEKKKRLQLIRKTIMNAVPEAGEVISYQIPAYKLNGFLIYISAAKNHISIAFPFSDALLKKFEAQLSVYKKSKAAIQFPDNEKLPLSLIAAIARFRKKENEMKITTGKK